MGSIVMSELPANIKLTLYLVLIAIMVIEQVIDSLVSKRMQASRKKKAIQLWY